MWDKNSNQVIFFRMISLRAIADVFARSHVNAQEPDFNILVRLSYKMPSRCRARCHQFQSRTYPDLQTPGALFSVRYRIWQKNRVFKGDYASFLGTVKRYRSNFYFSRICSVIRKPLIFMYSDNMFRWSRQLTRTKGFMFTIWILGSIAAGS